MKKAVIKREEWYPVYGLDTDPDEIKWNEEQGWDPIVEVDEALIVRYEAALKEFNEIQAILRRYGASDDA